MTPAADAAPPPSRAFGPTLMPGRYRHFKGKEYLLLCEARHTETDEPLVVYQCCYGEFDVWVRPRDSFLAPAPSGAGLQVRFAYIGPE